MGACLPFTALAAAESMEISPLAAASASSDTFRSPPGAVLVFPVPPVFWASLNLGCAGRVWPSASARAEIALIGPLLLVSPLLPGDCAAAGATKNTKEPIAAACRTTHIRILAPETLNQNDVVHLSVISSSEWDSSLIGSCTKHGMQESKRSAVTLDGSA